MARRITAADGAEWKVGREWLPWRIRLRRKDDDGWGLPDAPDLGGADEIAAIFLVVAAVIALIVALLLGWLVIALVIELLVLLVGFFAGVFARTVLRRPWKVRARAKGGRAEHTWQVRGWRASGELVDEVAGALEQGLPLPPAATSPAAVAAG